MAETQKRLKKNISFSAHEKDIYDYLEKQGNASAFIKRLILNQMMIDRGMVSPVAVNPSIKDEKQNVSQGTSEPKEQAKKPKEEKPKEQVKKLTPEELENMQIAQGLDI